MIPDLRPFFLTLNELPEKFLIRDFFGNNHPCEIEIGSGRGLFLLNQAIAQPERNWLGVEIDFEHGRFAADRFRRRDLNNVRIVGGDAHIFIRKFIQDRSLDGAHVYFPDPWWKRKHRRRRVFNREFVQEIARILKPGCSLHSWTDVEEYFGVIKALVGESPYFGAEETPQERAAEHDMDYLTNFERKKRQAGFMIYRARWVRNDNSPSEGKKQ